MQKRIIGFMVLAIILLPPLSLWAAGGQAAPDTQAAPAPVSGGPITLRFAWWGAEARHKATLENLAAYERKNPNIKFEPEYGAYAGFLDKLMVQIHSRTLPDIPSVDGKWVPDMMRNNRDSFRNLKEMNIDLSGFDPEFLKVICGNETFTLGVSMGTNTSGVTYSPAFFEKFGLGDPSNWSWEDYLEAGKKVQAQDKESYLCYTNMNMFGGLFKAYVMQLSGKNLVTDDLKAGFTEAEAERAYQYVLDLINTGTFPTFEETMPYALNYPQEVPKWLQGKYGVNFTQVSNLSATVNGSPFELKTAVLPKLKDAKSTGWAVSSSMVVGVNAHGNHQEEAVKFIDWFINDMEAIRVTGDTRGLPSSQRAAKFLSDNKMLMPQMVEFAEKYNRLGSVVDNETSVSTAVLELTNEYVQQVGFKRMTPKQAAASFRSELEKLASR